MAFAVSSRIVGHLRLIARKRLFATAAAKRVLRKIIINCQNGEIFENPKNNMVAEMSAWKEEKKGKAAEARQVQLP